MKQIQNPGRKSFLSATPFLVMASFLFLGSVSFRAGAAVLKLPVEAPTPINANSAAVALQNAFIDVAAKVSPAVVNISSEWTEDVRGMNDFGDMNDFFNYWFYGPRGGMQQHPQFKRKQRALGSGFIVTSDGYIITNAHVVGKAEKVTVTMEDGTTYPAKIIGKDERVDIAVIKITDGNKAFPTALLGDSDAIKVGQWAIAIGNPFALDHTVTTGVISAKGREEEVSQDQGAQSYIQTDASINPGNWLPSWWDIVAPQRPISTDPSLRWRNNGLYRLLLCTSPIWPRKTSTILLTRESRRRTPRIRVVAWPTALVCHIPAEHKGPKRRQNVYDRH